MEENEPAWNKDASYELKIYKWISWSHGLWPIHSNTTFSTLRIIFAVTTQITLMIPLLMEICQDCSTIDEKIDYLANFSCNIICLAKIVVLKIEEKKLRSNILHAMKDWSINHTPDSYKIMQSYAHTGKKVCKAQLSFLFFAIFSTVFANFPNLMSLNRNFDNISLAQNALPMPLNCIYQNMSLTKNNWIYGIQAIQFLWTGVGNCGIDVFFFGLAMHTCGQLEILKKDMSEFGKKSEEFQLRNDLQILIERHLHLIDLSQQLEDIFNKILMVQLLFNCFTIVILGFEVIFATKTGNAFLFTRALLSFVVLMVQILLYCYAGDYLSKLNEILSDGIYDSHWYNYPISIRKDLILIMVRTRVQFHITAGKFYNMDLENFKNIFKAYMSFISVLMVVINFDE